MHVYYTQSTSSTVQGGHMTYDVTPFLPNKGRFRSLYSTPVKVTDPITGSTVENLVYVSSSEPGKEERRAISESHGKDKSAPTDSTQGALVLFGCWYIRIGLLTETYC